MAKADTSVKWFHSEMSDAPVLSGQVGKLIELLDACLINGFSTRTPDSVVVSNGVATVSISAGNPYEKHAVIVISGGSVAELNSEWRIDTSGASAFTFLCPGVADGSVSGASVKRAPMGWGKPFSGTNIAVYQALDPSGTQLYLRVNDANTRYARVRGYEHMTDANTGTGAFPTSSLAENAYLWAKSTLTDGTARSWLIVGDQLLFYPAIIFDGSAGYTLNSFGDFKSLVPGDKYNCTISAHYNVTSPTSAAGHPGTCTNVNAAYPRFAARGGSQSGEPVSLGLVSPVSENASFFVVPSTDSNPYGPIGPTPNAARFFYTPPFVCDAASADVRLRGILPGIRPPIVGSDFAPGEFLSDEAGRAVLCHNFTKGLTSSITLIGILQIEGPWR